MKWSEFFSSAITGAREAGIEIEPDAPLMTAELIAVEQQPDPALLAVQAEATELREQIAKMKSDAAQQRAEALISGWAGAKEDHLLILGALGEGTPAYDAYVRQQRAAAEQQRVSAIFVERGSDRAEGIGSAWEQIQAKAKALIDATPGMTYAEAITQVSKRDPALYARYEAEK